MVKSLSDKTLYQNDLIALAKSLLDAKKLQTEPKSQSGGLLGSLLSAFYSQSCEAGSDRTLGLDKLLRAGMTFFQSKQDGDSNMEAIMDAIKASSPIGKTPHRAQPASNVASTLMDYAKNLSN